MKNYLDILIKGADPEKTGILVAHLSEAGFYGFEESDEGLHAFIEEGQLNEADLQTILEDASLSFHGQIIQEQNWNEDWEKSFLPVLVDGYCGIHAAFHDPVADAAINIIISPKMSFGTGHHATTYLMIEAMHGLDFVNKRVMDFGTGTGVLAILAEKSGASEIVAIDHDEWSIQNAQENLAANKCTKIILKKIDGPGTGTTYDIILANINKVLIINNLSIIKQQLSGAGVLLLSGLLAEDLEDMKNAARMNQLSISAVIERNGWLCLRLNEKAERS